MISDKIQRKRLSKKDTVIVTDYYDNGFTKTRSTDGSVSDDINAGVILAKKYYLHGSLLHQETEFNPGMLYSFVFPKLNDGRVQCPNCGGIGENALFSDGCPYCGAFYNMQYQTELHGGREHSDYVVKNRLGMLIPVVLIMAVCIAVGMFFFGTMGRTSTVFDFAKGALVGGIIGGALSILYNVMRTKSSLSAKEMRKKNEQDIILQCFIRDLGANGLNMGTFFNNLNLGLSDFFFGTEADAKANIIDFDILDYHDQNVSVQDGKVTVSTGVSIRLIREDHNRIWSEEADKRIRMIKSNRALVGLQAGLNITKCLNCGANIDVTAGKCSYCGTPIAFERPLSIQSIN